MEDPGIGETWIYQEFDREEARDLAKQLGHSVWARIKQFPFQRATWEVFSDHAVIHPDPCDFIERCCGPGGAVRKGL